MNKSRTDIVVGINNLYYFCILFLQIPKHCDYEKIFIFFNFGSRSIDYDSGRQRTGGRL